MPHKLRIALAATSPKPEIIATFAPYLVACATRTEKEKNDDAQNPYRFRRDTLGPGDSVRGRYRIGQP
jgi:hypothetical protein